MQGTFPSGNSDKYLVVISGPTASGKSALSVRIAQLYGTEILSADSRQFYREMQIGVAKPSAEELAAVPHHFIGHLSIHQPYNAGHFEQDALTLLDDLYEKYSLVVMAGGSGLFIRAVTEGFDALPEVPSAIRLSVQLLYEENGIQKLWEELELKDPAYLRVADRQNHRRLMRALEICLVSGRPFSTYRTGQAKPRPFKAIEVVLSLPREALYAQINDRVDSMMVDGLLQEAGALFPMRHLNALQTVGYQELFSYFEGRISLEEAVEKVKTNTRRYASRQLTWLRKYSHGVAFHPADYSAIINFIEEKIKKDV